MRPVGQYNRRYSERQRLAVQQAFGDRGIKRPKQLVALAAAGELTADGELVDAFTLTESSARDIGERYVKRRARIARAAVADQEPADAVEALRRRLVAVINEQLTAVERLQAAHKHNQIKGEQLRQLARALRELAALPGPDGGKRSRAPGAHDPAQGKTPDGTTRGGLAGKIRATTQPRPIAPVHDDATTEHSDSGEAERSDASDSDARSDQREHSDHDADSADPGSWARERIAGLRASSVSVQS